MNLDQIVLSGHFELSSGQHSDTYFQTARLTRHLESLYWEVANFLSDNSAFFGGVDAIVGPGIPGTMLGTLVAIGLSKPLFICERPSPGAPLVFKREALGSNQRCLVVDNVLTTGGTLCEAADLVRETGSMVAGYLVLVNRNPAYQTPDGKSILSMETVQARSWPQEECPLCLQGVSVVKPGSKPAETRAS